MLSTNNAEQIFILGAFYALPIFSNRNLKTQQLKAIYYKERHFFGTSLNLLQIAKLPNYFYTNYKRYESR